VGGLDFEQAEEEEKEEEIVDGERLFDSVACEVLGSRQASHGAEDEETKGKGSGDPEDGGRDGGGLRFRGALIANVEKLDPEEDENEDVKAYPMADWGRCEHHLWMLQCGAWKLYEGPGGAVLRGEPLGRFDRVLTAEACGFANSGCQLACAGDH